MDDLTLRQFQQHIETRYGPTDRARGTPRTWMWFIEEVGELSHALGKKEAGEEDRANTEEEFADVLAWLCTLANINDIDLTTALRQKYLSDDAPSGEK
jgi:NTP pyrophosphatase (non-canonical NTP hydrolase)